jgi:hypothetical protein
MNNNEKKNNWNWYKPSNTRIHAHQDFNIN